MLTVMLPDDLQVTEGLVVEFPVARGAVGRAGPCQHCGDGRSFEGRTRGHGWPWGEPLPQGGPRCSGELRALDAFASPRLMGDCGDCRVPSLPLCDQGQVTSAL